MTLITVVRRAVIAALILVGLIVFALERSAAQTAVRSYPTSGAGGPVSIAILADHFTSDEQADFEAAARNLVNFGLLSDPDYAPHASDFTVTTIFEPWRKSAAT